MTKIKKLAEHIMEEVEGAKEYADDGFLEELVALVQTHDCSREKLLTLFGKYSQAVEIQDMQDADFDYAIHCKDRENDPYYYCFHEEGCHIIYHRFTPEDYADLIS